MSPTTNSTFEHNHHFEPTNQNSSQKKKEKNHTVLLNFCYSSKQIPSFNLTNQDQIVEIESRNERLFSQLLSLNHKINKISSTEKQLIQPRNYPKDQKTQPFCRIPPLPKQPSRFQAPTLHKKNAENNTHRHQFSAGHHKIPNQPSFVTI